MSRIEAEAREALLRRRRSLFEIGPSEGEPGRDRALGPSSDAALRELAEIDAALQRIEQGLYGSCLSCGGAMGLQRLRALPEARYCVGCSGGAIA